MGGGTWDDETGGRPANPRLGRPESGSRSSVSAAGDSAGSGTGVPSAGTTSGEKEPVPGPPPMGPPGGATRPVSPSSGTRQGPVLGPPPLGPFGGTSGQEPDLGPLGFTSGATAGVVTGPSETVNGSCARPGWEPDPGPLPPFGPTGGIPGPWVPGPAGTGDPGRGSTYGETTGVVTGPSERVDGSWARPG